MLKAAHDPLLVEALGAYFAHFPAVEHKWVEKSLFGFYVGGNAQKVLHKFRLWITTKVGDGEYSLDEKILMHTVEEVASFIARMIAENRCIEGLRVDQP